MHHSFFKSILLSLFWSCLVFAPSNAQTFSFKKNITLDKDVEESFLKEATSCSDLTDVEKEQLKKGINHLLKSGKYGFEMMQGTRSFNYDTPPPSSSNSSSSKKDLTATQRFEDQALNVPSSIQEETADSSEHITSYGAHAQIIGHFMIQWDSLPDKIKTCAGVAVTKILFGGLGSQKSAKKKANSPFNKWFVPFEKKLDAFFEQDFVAMDRPAKIALDIPVAAKKSTKDKWIKIQKEYIRIAVSDAQKANKLRYSNLKVSQHKNQFLIVVSPIDTSTLSTSEKIQRYLALSLRSGGSLVKNTLNSFVIEPIEKQQQHKDTRPNYQYDWPE